VCVIFETHFNAYISQYKITYDEILQRTLWFAIWNHDSFGHNDFLGEVLVPIDQYHQSGFSLEDPEPQWYDLCERVSFPQKIFPLEFLGKFLGMADSMSLAMGGCPNATMGAKNNFPGMTAWAKN
jgi:hypothetical protein